MVNNVSAVSSSIAASASPQPQTQSKSISSVESKTSSGVDSVSTSIHDEIKKTNSQGDEISASSVSQGEVESAVNELNERLQSNEIQVAFTVDKGSGKVVVQITDNDTGELLRQVPSEESLKFARSVSKGVGVLLDKTG
jgi:flagellar protein FlaG